MMTDYIYTVFIIAMDIYCCILLFQSFAEKRDTKNKLVPFVEVCILAVLYLVISFALRDYIHLKFMAFIVATSIMMTLMFQIRYLKALGLSIFFCSIDTMADYAAVVIFGKAYFWILGRAFEWSDMFPLCILSLISKMALFGVVLSVKKIFGRKSPEILTGREWWVLFFISLITVFSLAAMVAKTNLFQNTNQDSTFLLIAMGLLLINFIIYYLVNEIAERGAKIREDALFRERVRNETAMYRSISENLEKQRRRTHEYKNQLACISALAAKGQYKELDEYIGKIDDALQHSMDAIDTNNVIVNAILNTKYREAVSRGIVFVLKVNDLSGLAIRDEDIVVILSNLLNNALEACEHCGEKVIRLKFVLEEGQTVVSVKNSIGTELAVEKGRLLTTKADSADEHGMGIKNVVEAVERYGGRYVIDYDKGFFQFTILLPNGLTGK